MKSHFISFHLICTTSHRLDGYENAPMQFVGGSSPDEIPIPGQISMDIDSILTEDMPNDMVTKLNLKKLEPFPLDVPCLNGLGSWYVNFFTTKNSFFGTKSGHILINNAKKIYTASIIFLLFHIVNMIFVL